MTLRLLSPDMLTVSGSPLRSSTTSEQVASNPMPLTGSGEIPASAIAPRTAAAQASQMSDEDCSTMSPASCQTWIGRFAVPSRVPSSSKIPARVLEVPTSMPIKACRISAPVSFDASLPACVAAIDKNNTSSHQARRLGSKEKNDGCDLVYLPQPRHRRAAHPGVVHTGVAFDEGIEGRFDISGGNRIDPHAARGPLGGKRFGQMVHRGFGGVVIALLLRLVDDKPRHRTNIDN